MSFLQCVADCNMLGIRPGSQDGKCYGASSNGQTVNQMGAS